jgi:hypothetical protein
VTVDRVYIVGAGASVPYGLPTLKTLTWDLCESLNGPERQTFIRAVYEACGVELRGPESSPDFEELLNRLDSRALKYLEGMGYGGTDSIRVRAAEIAVRGLRSFIRERCLQMREKDGPFDRLAQHLTERTLVVSFNWDVLLESALQRACREYTYRRRGLRALSPYLSPTVVSTGLRYSIARCCC